MKIAVHWLDIDGKHTGRQGEGAPYIRVDIIVPHAQISVPGSVWALIDTGANMVCGRPGLLRSYGHRLAETSVVTTAGGVPTVRTLFDLHLGLKDETNRGWRAKFAVCEIMWPPEAGPHDLILGRNFLRNTSFDWRPDVGMDCLTWHPD